LLVVIAIIAILAAILFPVFAKAREKARQASCSSNVKQLAISVLMYAQDYDEALPGFYSRLVPPNPWPLKQWVHDIYPYTKNWQIFRCPSGGDSNTSANTPPAVPRVPIGYGTNPWAMSGGRGNFNNNMAQFARPSEMVVIFDAYRAGRYCTYPMGYNLGSRGDDCRARPDGIVVDSSGAATVNGTNTARHNEGSNVAFGDGHVKWLRAGTWERVPNPAGNDPNYAKYWRRSP